MYQHDGSRIPCCSTSNASEALCAATLAVIFLAVRGGRFVDWRRASLAALLSAGLGLAVGKVISDFIGARWDRPVERGSSFARLRSQ